MSSPDSVRIDDRMFHVRMNDRKLVRVDLRSTQDERQGVLWRRLGVEGQP